MLPALDAFAPELVLISAGFDAHRSDPLAQLMLEEADYTWVTEQLLRDCPPPCRRADGLDPRGRLRSGARSAASAAAHVRVLMSA